MSDRPDGPWIGKVKGQSRGATRGTKAIVSLPPSWIGRDVVVVPRDQYDALEGALREIELLDDVKTARHLARGGLPEGLPPR